MRKTWKFLHTLAACGVIGALLGYAVLLAHAPQDTPEAYAAMRQSISALCDYILFPSLAVVLITGLLAMAAHHPFVEMRWACSSRSRPPMSCLACGGRGSRRGNGLRAPVDRRHAPGALGQPSFADAAWRAGRFLHP